ncbi:phosphate ABC transporter substrate-binding protein PstS [Rhodococcus sp. BP-252]|uniref:Phosphate-binding protein n=1 Tax=Rhodococcoides kyotonense TaxID=398843 RepID=A0A177YGC7_9NOCA|nr:MULTISPECIES: phosphate ABC transporter substrate-binding protein PstS [Rhodococcus]NIL75187.1 Phosphate-binding protein PstS3 [Rhodococcus sp. B10]MBY6412730.1 phosphate ABC transporter substrate-binding protein PstS [Rhodococcus sp. BP-320]MBY6417472.1 phosphate ABC transporter substrate-binding protein PstS [Rhodococcus sp. BP-321]MBY6421750.1 phosphate ABC transporter substrate-binding protein PstS [Rhodococcus sp. BP-324]MBY6427489.1 phosphate ABC transporter substrate-binding protein 
MKLKRSASLVGAVAVGAMLLTACGSDANVESAAGTDSAATCEGKSPLTGEGSSAQQNAMSNFTSIYSGVCSGQAVEYTTSGSGNGRTQFVAGLVDFAGSDSTIKDEQAAQAAERCEGNPAWNLPLVFGPIAVAYNLDGVDNLVVTPEIAARIFNGQITTWNDPAIAAANEGATLPSTPITPIYRSDSSGTSDNFQRFLSAAAPEAWTLDHSSDWAGGVGEGANGSSGVAQAVAATPGSITYVEKGFAEQESLGMASVDFGNGPVELSSETAGAAIDTATFSGEGNDLAIDIDALYASDAADSYPLVLATYEIVCSAGYDADTSAAVKSFLLSAANEGQEGLEAAGYVPLPESFKERLVTAINAIA